MYRNDHPIIQIGSPTSKGDDRNVIGWNEHEGYDTVLSTPIEAPHYLASRWFCRPPGLLTPRNYPRVVPEKGPYLPNGTVPFLIQGEAMSECDGKKCMHPECIEKRFRGIPSIRSMAGGVAAGYDPVKWAAMPRRERRARLREARRRK